MGTFDRTSVMLQHSRETQWGRGRERCKTQVRTFLCSCFSAGKKNCDCVRNLLFPLELVWCSGKNTDLKQTHLCNFVQINECLQVLSFICNIPISQES